jgi:DNA gyrase subunit B
VARAALFGVSAEVRPKLGGLMASENAARGADGIVVLPSLEAVRRRPGMYIGDVHDGSGLHHMLWEIVANSLDEHLAGRATRIRVSIENGLAEVEDDGRGIPVEVVPAHGMPFVQVVLTHLHQTPTFDQHLPHVHVSSSRSGLGLGPVNALCEELEVEIWRNGYAWRQRYQRGMPATELERGARTTRTGTRVRIRPDPTIFTMTHFDRRAVRTRIEELAIWNPRLTWDFMSEPIREPRGMPRWIERMATENDVGPIGDVFVTRATRSGVFVEVACGWSSNPRGELRSYVGQNLTRGGGTHERGFWQGLALAIAQRLGIASPAAGRAYFLRKHLAPGLLALVHVGLRDPLFAGPCREKLDSPDACNAVRAQVSEAFAAHLSQHPALERMLFARIAAHLD